MHKDIYEVRAIYNIKAYRILFACEGRFNHILLSLEGFQKKTQQTPRDHTFMEEARQRRELMNALAAVRSSSRISQSTLAKQIKTSQPAIARLEAGAVDPRLSTLQRNAASVGKRIQWTIIDV